MTDVSPQIVAAARVLMASGASMHEAAEALRVTPSSGLDLGLWRYFGIKTADLFAGRVERRSYAPDFE